MSLPLAADCRSRDWKAVIVYLMQVRSPPALQGASIALLHLSNNIRHQLRNSGMSVVCENLVLCEVFCDLFSGYFSLEAKLWTSPFISEELFSFLPRH